MVRGMAVLMICITLVSCAQVQGFVRSTSSSFEDCMAKGASLSALGGLAVGATVNSNKTEKGAVVGIASLVATWFVCANAHKKLESSQIGTRDEAITTPPTKPLELFIDEFTITATKPGEDTTQSAKIRVVSNDPNKKDIKLKQSWVYFFASTEGGKTEYPTDNTVSKNGVAVFDEELVVQQGVRQGGGKIPTFSNIPAKPDWYAMLKVQGEGQCVASMLRIEFGNRVAGELVTCDSSPDRKTLIVPTNDSRAATSVGGKPTSGAGSTSNSTDAAKKRPSTGKATPPNAKTTKNTGSATPGEATKGKASSTTK